MRVMRSKWILIPVSSQTRRQDRQFKGQAFPPFMQKIIAAGGLINYINED